MERTLKIDWSKTIENIKTKLKGRTYAKNFSEVLYVSERAAEYKLLSDKVSELTIEELYKLSKFFECHMEDLLVFIGDDYYHYPDNHSYPVEYTNPQEVKEAIEMNQSIYETYEIRNLEEFILYLPLVEDYNLKQVIYRCSLNLDGSHNHYVMEQLNWLYKSIPDTKAKQEADWYRDNVLRVKGDKDKIKVTIRNLGEYIKKLDYYARSGIEWLKDNKII